MNHEQKASSLIIWFLLLLSEITAKNCNFNVQVEQKLHNEGFHRNLSIKIDFASDYEDERGLYEDCMVGIEQTLPAGVYSSTDDINDNGCKSLVCYDAFSLDFSQVLLNSRVNLPLVRNAVPTVKHQLGGCSVEKIIYNYINVQIQLHTIFKTPVNIELPAQKSEMIIMHLLSKVKDYRTHIYIPVHARYHQAVSGGWTVRNEIPLPKLYLLCPKRRLDECADLYSETTDHNNFCADNVSKEQCSWKEIPIIMVTAPITWDVPRGNSDHYPIVASGTAIVAIAGSLYLLNALHQYQTQIHKNNKKAL